MTAVIPSHIQVVFFQGIFSTFYQIERTVGLLFSRDSLLRAHPAEDLDEVIRNDFTWNPFYLIQMFVTWVTGRWGAPYAINIFNINIGQGSDVKSLIKREKGLEPQDDYVSFGISRGALTTFIRYASEPVTKLPKFVLLEGCPDSIPNVLQYRYGSSGKIIIETILGWATQYRPHTAETLSPLALLDKWPKNIPIAFVTSKKDTAVPMEGTIRLAEGLINRGHKSVHLLVLEDAHHNNYLSASERDKKAYIEFVGELGRLYCQ